MSLTTLPCLDHFLNAYMHQDWTIFGDSLQDVVKTFADDSSPEDVRGLQADIGAFVRGEGSHLEADFRKLFPNSASPSGWGMSAEQWLNHVAGLAGAIAPPTHFSGQEGD
jgi:hypothetical protein